MSVERLSRPAHGVVLILLSGLSVAAWAVHVFALTALAGLNQRHHDVIWIMQAVTVVTAIPCLLTMALGWSAVRRTTTPEDEGSPTGRTVFLAWMALAIGTLSLVLILLEAAYVSLIDRYA
jgi:hypothetical protein